MTLSVWQKCGVIASIIWAVGSLLALTWFDDYSRQRFAEIMDCTPDQVWPSWISFFLLGLLPIVLAWLLGWTVLRTR